MERLVGGLLIVMAAVMVLGYALAHLGIVLLLLGVVTLVGRHLRRHGI